jgi:hypothetical protein
MAGNWRHIPILGVNVQGFTTHDTATQRTIVRRLQRMATPVRFSAWQPAHRLCKNPIFGPNAACLYNRTQFARDVRGLCLGKSV